MNFICGADMGEIEDDEEKDDGSCTVHTVDQIYMWGK